MMTVQEQTPELAREVEKKTLHNYHRDQWQEEHALMVNDLVQQLVIPRHLVAFGRETFIWEFLDKAFRHWKLDQERRIEARYRERVAKLEAQYQMRRQQAVVLLPHIEAEYGGQIERVLNEIISRAASGACGCKKKMLGE